MFLSTRIKSPIINVGIIEPEGILYGSIKNERRISTTNSTGKIEEENSRTFFRVDMFVWTRLNTPVVSVANTKRKVKSIAYSEVDKNL